MIVKALAAVLVLSAFALAEAPGEAVFKKNCVMCHGADGTGKTKMGLKLGAADLTTNDIQSLSDEALAQSIRNGKGKMPPFKDKLTQQDTDNLLAYLRTL